MIAGEVVEELAKINFEKAEKALRVLALGRSGCSEATTIFCVIT